MFEPTWQLLTILESLQFTATILKDSGDYSFYVVVRRGVLFRFVFVLTLGDGLLLDRLDKLGVLDSLLFLN